MQKITREVTIQINHVEASDDLQLVSQLAKIISLESRNGLIKNIVINRCDKLMNVSLTFYYYGEFLGVYEDA